MCVYAILTDGYGKVPVIVSIVDVDAADEPLFEAKAEVEFTDPRMMVELTFALDGVTFPAPGEYRIQLFAGSEFVIERRIVLQHVEGESEDEQ